MNNIPTGPSEQEISRRREVVDAILLKMSRGTGQLRKSLLSWAKSVSKRFTIAEAIKVSILTHEAVTGQLSKELETLRKYNAELFEEMMLTPSAELEQRYRLMSGAAIQHRYGRRISDREIGVPIELEGTRPIDLTRKQASDWLRTKANKQAVAQRQQVVAVIQRKAKTVAANHAARVKGAYEGKAYVADVKAQIEFVNKGLQRREKWMQTIERRTLTKQSRSNIA